MEIGGLFLALGVLGLSSNSIAIVMMVVVEFWSPEYLRAEFQYAFREL